MDESEANLTCDSFLFEIQKSESHFVLDCIVLSNFYKMSKNKKLTKEEELLLQDFGRNVSTKSSLLFYCNAFFVSAVPLCKY